MALQAIAQAGRDHAPHLCALLMFDGVKSSHWTQERQRQFNLFVHAQHEIIRTRNSYIYGREEGDALLLAMSSVKETVDFALKLLLSAIPEYEWADRERDGPPQIRCALHVAEISLLNREGKDVEVVGDGVIQVKRVEPVADPGKLICTESAKNMLENIAANRFSLKSIGERKLDKNAGVGKLYEVGLVTDPSSSNLRQSPREAPLSAKHWATRDFRDFMHFHKGKALEFFFLTSERHRALLIAMERASQMTKAGKTGRGPSIQSAEKRLREFITKELESICFRTCKKIETCFQDRRATPVRACVKVYVNDGGSSELGHPSIKTIARTTEVPYDNDFEKTYIDNNTGFRKAQVTKCEFLSNDLLADILNRSYTQNRRLNIDQILADRDVLKNMTEEEISKHWPRYWDNGSINAEHISSCYRSTLIIPMTLMNNDLSNEFKTEFKFKSIENKNIEHVIFGYLCLDHVEPDYFVKPGDIDIGYFFADILTLYQVVALAFTAGSETYQMARKVLQAQLVRKPIRRRKKF